MTAVSEVWTCFVTPSDGVLDGLPGSASMTVAPPPDNDGDGWSSIEDCDDGDPTVYPWAGDSSGDGVDQDCDGLDCDAGDYLGIYFASCLGSVSWGDADSLCVAAGYDGLESLFVEGESDFLVSLMQAGPPPPPEQHRWIGLNDQAIEGAYLWLDGSPSSFTNWNVGEPNNAGPEDCVFAIYLPNLSALGTWNDAPCSQTWGFACELR